MSKGVTLGGLKIKDLINEGRPLSLVLDSSITLAWYFEDERDARPRELSSIRLSKKGAIVPALWRFEVANGLQMAVRRKRIDAAFRDRASRRPCRHSTIEIDPDSDAYAWSASVQLAERHGLTVYDAAYLELAQRRRLRACHAGQCVDQGSAAPSCAGDRQLRSARRCN